MEDWRYNSTDSCPRQLMQLTGQLQPTATLLAKKAHPAGWAARSVRILLLTVTSHAPGWQRTTTPLLSRTCSTYCAAYFTSSKVADSRSPSKQTPSPARNPKVHRSVHKTPLKTTNSTNYLVNSHHLIWHVSVLHRQHSSRSFSIMTKHLYVFFKSHPFFVPPLYSLCFTLSRNAPYGFSGELVIHF